MSLHPGAWVAWAVAAGAVALSTTNPFYLLPLAAAAWLCHAVARTEGPGVRSFRLFVAFGLGALATRVALALLPVGGRPGAAVLVAAFHEGLRLAVLLIAFGTFNSVTEPYALVGLAPRRFHEVALAAGLALSIAPRLIDAAARVREAQRLRGIEVRGLRAVAAMAVPVLENGMEQAVTLAESMDARGHGRGRRSRYRLRRVDGRSLAAGALALAGGAGFLIALALGRADLSGATFPLGWPRASFDLLFCVGLLGAPGLLALGGRR
jgi:energy-coupling factor transport system permease protein